MAGEFILSLQVIGAAIPSVILIYGAYWAFAIRRAIFTGVYRSQALWIGFFSLYFIGYVSGLDNGAPGVSLTFDLLVTAYYVVLSLLLFRLIDVDVNVARRSDPLLRDTLRWRTLRLIIWTIIMAASFLVFIVAASRDIGIAIPPLIIAVSQALVYLPMAIPGVIGLTIGARRSADQTLRRSLEWLGLFFVALLLTSLSYFLVIGGLVTVPRDLYNSLGGLAFIPAAYCLYRSAKSLAPLGRISLERPS